MLSVADIAVALAMMCCLSDAYTVWEKVDVYDGRCYFEGRYMDHEEIIRTVDPCESYKCNAKKSIVSIDLCHYGVYQAAPPNCTLKKNSGDFPNCCPWPDCEPPLESDNDFRLDLDDALKTRGTNSFDEGSIKVNTISRGATHDDLRASPNINVGPSNSTSQNASSDRVDPQPASRDDSPLRPGDLKDHQETPAGVDKVVVYVVSSEKTTAEPQNATSSAADSTVTSPMVNEDALNTATTPGEGLVAAESSVDAATDCQAMCDRLRAFAAKHNSTVPECGCV